MPPLTVWGMDLALAEHPWPNTKSTSPHRTGIGNIAAASHWELSSYPNTQFRLPSLPRGVLVAAPEESQPVCGGVPLTHRSYHTCSILADVLHPSRRRSLCLHPNSFPNPTQVPHKPKANPPIPCFPLLFPRTQQWKARSRVNPLLTRR